MEIAKKLIDIFKEHGHDKTMKSLNIVLNINGKDVGELEKMKKNTSNPKLLKIINMTMISKLENENQDIDHSLKNLVKKEPVIFVKEETVVGSGKINLSGIRKKRGRPKRK